MVDTNLYPNVITIKRSAPTSGASDAVGGVGYSGMTEAPATVDASSEGETTLYTGIPANIYAGATGRKKDSSLPSDVFFMPTWNISIPASALAKASVRDRDIVYDEESYKYQVGQAEWTILGYQLVCIRLEA